MTSRRRDFKIQERVLLCLAHRKAVPGQERVVTCVDNEGRHPDGREILEAAALPPIIFGIPEPVDGGSVAVVKFSEGPDGFIALVIDQAGHQGHFSFDFDVKVLEEPFHVDAVGRPGKHVGAGFEIAGNGKRDSPGNNGCDSIPPQIHQGQIATQAEPPKTDTCVAAGRLGMGDDMGKVVGGTVVVEPEAPVRLLAASTVIPCQSVHA